MLFSTLFSKQNRKNVKKQIFAFIFTEIIFETCYSMKDKKNIDLSSLNLDRELKLICARHIFLSGGEVTVGQVHSSFGTKCIQF